MKKGFTLVELSIVLVVIGLIVGGIVITQSLISNSQISATVKQIGEFDSATLTFKEQYKYLVSDAPAFGGDGDGVIDQTAISNYDDQSNDYACEIANYWNVMDPDTYKAGVCAPKGGPKYVSGANKNVPEAKMGIDGSFFYASALSTSGATVNKTTKQNYYAILNPGQITDQGGGYYGPSLTTIYNSAVKPNDLYALDTKMDDGLANSGIIQSGNIKSIGSDPKGNLSNSGLSDCSSGSGYMLSYDGYYCTPIIRIGGSANNSQ